MDLAEFNRMTPEEKQAWWREKVRQFNVRQARRYRPTPAEERADARAEQRIADLRGK